MGQFEKQNGGILGTLENLSRTKFLALILALGLSYLFGSLLYDNIADSKEYTRQSINRLIKSIEEKNEKYELCQQEIIEIKDQIAKAGRKEVEVLLTALNKSAESQDNLAKALRELKNEIK